MPGFVTNFINISGCGSILLLIGIDFLKKGEVESWKETFISIRWQIGPLPSAKNRSRSETKPRTQVERKMN